MSPFHLACIFRSGDLTEERLRPRTIGQFWVVQVCLRDPLRAVQVYKELRAVGTHPAERFLAMLEIAKESPFRLWCYEVAMKRKVVPLPA